MKARSISIVPDDLAARDAYRLMTSVIVPRPIAWVSTVGIDGTLNLAPFSFYCPVSGKPPTVMFSLGLRADQPKDTLRNVQETGEFVLNVVDESLAEPMNETAGEWPYEVDEFALAGLAAAPSVDVRPPRVAIAPVAMEARVTQIHSRAGDVQHHDHRQDIEVSRTGGSSRAGRDGRP
jgi:flavin reductase (DIM6/NTAB) family NADH-FMN oxidoreductase RutF